MGKVIRWLQKLFSRDRCEHHFRKHWSRKAGEHGNYVKRCTKCGKVE